MHEAQLRRHQATIEAFVGWSTWSPPGCGIIAGINREILVEISVNEISGSRAHNQVEMSLFARWGGSRLTFWLASIRNQTLGHSEVDLLAGSAVQHLCQGNVVGRRHPPSGQTPEAAETRSPGGHSHAAHDEREQEGRSGQPGYQPLRWLWFGARPNGREVAQISLGDESPHAVDTLIREMPLRDWCRCLNDNLRMGDEVSNAHVDLRQHRSA